MLNNSITDQKWTDDNKKVTITIKNEGRSTNKTYYEANILSYSLKHSVVSGDKLKFGGLISKYLEFELYRYKATGGSIYKGDIVEFNDSKSKKVYTFIVDSIKKVDDNVVKVSCYDKSLMADTTCSVYGYSTVDMILNNVPRAFSGIYNNPNLGKLRYKSIKKRAHILNAVNERTLIQDIYEVSNNGFKFCYTDTETSFYNSKYTTSPKLRGIDSSFYDIPLYNFDLKDNEAISKYELGDIRYRFSGFKYKDIENIFTTETSSSYVPYIINSNNQFLKLFKYASVKDFIMYKTIEDLGDLWGKFFCSGTIECKKNIIIEPGEIIRLGSDSNLYMIVAEVEHKNHSTTIRGYEPETEATIEGNLGATIDETKTAPKISSATLSYTNSTYKFEKEYIRTMDDLGIVIENDFTNLNYSLSVNIPNWIMEFCLKSSNISTIATASKFSHSLDFYAIYQDDYTDYSSLQSKGILLHNALTRNESQTTNNPEYYMTFNDKENFNLDLTDVVATFTDDSKDILIIPVVKLNYTGSTSNNSTTISSYSIKHDFSKSALKITYTLNNLFEKDLEDTGGIVITDSIEETLDYNNYTVDYTGDFIKSLRFLYGSTVTNAVSLAQKFRQLVTLDGRYIRSAYMSAANVNSLMIMEIEAPEGRDLILKTKVKAQNPENSGQCYIYHSTAIDEFISSFKSKSPCVNSVGARLSDNGTWVYKGNESTFKEVTYTITGGGTNYLIFGVSIGTMNNGQYQESLVIENITLEGITVAGVIDSQPKEKVTLRNKFDNLGLTLTTKAKEDLMEVSSTPSVVIQGKISGQSYYKFKKPFKKDPDNLELSKVVYIDNLPDKTATSWDLNVENICPSMKAYPNCTENIGTDDDGNKLYEYTYTLDSAIKNKAVNVNFKVETIWKDESIWVRPSGNDIIYEKIEYMGNTYTKQKETVSDTYSCIPNYGGYIDESSFETAIPYIEKYDSTYALINNYGDPEYLGAIVNKISEGNYEVTLQIQLTHK